MLLKKLAVEDYYLFFISLKYFINKIINYIFMTLQ
jgi:hypothetical protein